MTASKKSDTMAIYEDIAKTIQQSDKAPHGINPGYPQFKTPYIDAINQAIDSLRKDLHYLCSGYQPSIHHEVLKEVEKSFPHIRVLDPSVKERFNQVTSGEIERAANNYHHLRENVLRIALHLSRITAYMRFTDQEIGIPSGIEKLLPEEYIKKLNERYQDNDKVELCSICGIVKLTRKDIELSEKYCPGRGHMCETCRYEYLNEFREAYERQHEIEQEKIQRTRRETKA